MIVLLNYVIYSYNVLITLAFWSWEEMSRTGSTGTVTQAIWQVSLHDIMAKAKTARHASAYIQPVDCKINSV